MAGPPPVAGMSPVATPAQVEAVLRAGRTVTEIMTASQWPRPGVLKIATRVGLRHNPTSDRCATPVAARDAATDGLPAQPNAAGLRAWARAVGCPVGERGRVGAEVVDAWREAHGYPAPRARREEAG